MIFSCLIKYFACIAQFDIIWKDILFDIMWYHPINSNMIACNGEVFIQLLFFLLYLFWIKINFLFIFIFQSFWNSISYTIDDPFINSMLNDKNKNKNNKKIETTHVEGWQPSLSLIHVTPAPPNPTRATTTIFSSEDGRKLLHRRPYRAN